MIYVGFPNFTEAERMSALAAIPWQACCRIADKLIPDDVTFGGAQLENLLGQPVLRLRRLPRPNLVIDLADGAGVQGFTADDARAIALDAAAHMIGAPTAIAADAIDEDQWTVGRYQRDRPLHRCTFDDPARTTLYVSSASGQILLRTTARQRFWSWLGAIPHWLYFTALRTDGLLWTQIVTWAQIAHVFLTIVGLTRRHAIQAWQERRRVAVSRPVLLAPLGWARVRHLHPYLRGEWPCFHEPMGLLEGGDASASRRRLRAYNPGGARSKHRLMRCGRGRQRRHHDGQARHGQALLACHRPRRRRYAARRPRQCGTVGGQGDLAQPPPRGSRGRRSPRMMGAEDCTFRLLRASRFRSIASFSTMPTNTSTPSRPAARADWTGWHAGFRGKGLYRLISLGAHVPNLPISS